MTPVSFKSLPVGSRFMLTHKPPSPFLPPHGSSVLEKIEPYPIPEGKIRKGLEGTLSYTAKWTDGSHAEEPCVVTDGTEKEPKIVLALEPEENPIP